MFEEKQQHGGWNLRGMGMINNVFIKKQSLPVTVENKKHSSKQVALLHWRKGFFATATVEDW